MSDTPDGRDATLARLLEELLAARRCGQPADVEGVARERPDLVAELRELWTLAELVDDAATAADPHDPASRAGEHLPRAFGGYRLVREVGRGGMGVVYEAEQRSLGRRVALKTILRGEHASAQDLARFRAEAESAARLEHPAILPVHEIGEHEGLLYFTMRLIEGESLAQRLWRGPLPPRHAARLVGEVARAIQHSHERGVLHRDIKPSNILLDRDGRPYVADFGLARRLRSDAGLTASQALVGTPGYMAPEQAAGSRGQLTAATDVWGLGAVLYHALCGRAPFVGRTPVDTLLQVLEQDPPPPSLIAPQLDRELEMITLKCLQKPADLRYHSAAALAEDLDAWLAHEPVAARRGRLRDVVARALRETHHATVLEHWGALWMLHGGVLLALCSLTWLLQLRGIDQRWPYLSIWGVGIGVWAAVFWLLRRRAGPVTFIERQLANVWGSSVLSCFLLLCLEWQLGLPALRLAPVIALFSGGVFFVKAAMLSGRFYLHAAALYAVALPMALWPRTALLLFGVVAGLTFFLPGLRARRQRRDR
ncbi:MAG: serine/threonine-protein kinase [Planctomycetota bacterium]